MPALSSPLPRMTTKLAYDDFSVSNHNAGFYGETTGLRRTNYSSKLHKAHDFFYFFCQHHMKVYRTYGNNDGKFMIVSYPECDCNGQTI